MLLHFYGQLEFKISNFFLDFEFIAHMIVCLITMTIERQFRGVTYFCMLFNFLKYNCKIFTK